MSEEVEITETSVPSSEEVKVSKFERIKGHVEKNKWLYVGTVVVVLSRGYFKPAMVYAPTLNITEVMNHIRQIGILSKQEITTNTIKIYSDGRGRPGNFCHLFGRPEIGYPSQTEAAKIFGVTDKMMSMHLNGKLPHIKGYRLVRPVV